MSLKKKIVDSAISLAAIGAFVGIPLIGAMAWGRHKERTFVESNKPIVCTVLEESYKNDLSKSPKWDGLVSYSNETVKLDSKYTLKVETDSGKVMGVSIIDGDNIKKEALDILIKPGSRLSFPRGTQKYSRSGAEFEDETYFGPETQVGTKRADRVRILR